MYEFQAILGFGITIMVMLTGFVWILRGPNGAVALWRWVGRTLWRIVCRVIGGTFSLIGRTIQGWGR